MDSAASPPPDRLAYSVREFELKFGVSHTKTYEEIGAGRLRAKKLGAKTMIGHADAMAWFESLPVAQPAVRA